MKLLKGTRVKDAESKATSAHLESVESLILVNCSVRGNELTAGYFYCDRGLQSGNYRLLSDNGRTFIIKLPEQAVNLPGIGQQFNYPFEIIEEIV
jgi:hypothetical protein